MFAAFANRTAKLVYEKKVGETIECDARMPQGVVVEACEKCDFTTSKKTSSIVLNRCSNVSASIAGVISSIDVHKSLDCSIVSTASCPLFTVEDSKSVTIRFQPEHKTSVVFKNSSAVTVAVGEPDSDKEVVKKIDIPEGDEESQYQIDWDGESLGDLFRLERQGRHGFIANQNNRK